MAHFRDTINIVALLMSGSYLGCFNVDMLFTFLLLGSLSLLRHICRFRHDRSVCCINKLDVPRKELLSIYCCISFTGTGNISAVLFVPFNNVIQSVSCLLRMFFLCNCF